MKKLLLVTIGLSLMSSVAFAGELIHGKLLMKNIRLELQLLNTRAEVLRYQARDVQARIDELEAKTEKKIEKPKTEGSIKP